MRYNAIQLFFITSAAYGAVAFGTDNALTNFPLSVYHRNDESMFLLCFF